MSQNPEILARELAEAARAAVDEATRQFMRRNFKMGVPAEVGVSLLMKACAERLSETTDGQERLNRHITNWANQISRNRSFGRPFRNLPKTPPRPAPPREDPEFDTEDFDDETDYAADDPR